MVKLNSTIFRTIKDEATGANQSIGLFGKSFGELKTILSSVKTNGLFKTNTISESDISCIEKYNTLIKDGIPHQQAMEQATKGASDATKQMIKNANGNTIALNQMTLGSKAASVAMKALSIAGNMLVFTAITTGISLLTKAIDDYIHTSENAIALTDELKSKHQEIQSEYESHRQTVEELASSYERLSKGVDTLTNKNINLSDEDYEEYLRITNELSEAFPSLYKTLDDNGNAILTLGQNGRTASEDLRELLKAEEDLNNYKISQDIVGLFGGVKVQIDEAKESLDEYKASSDEMDKAFQVLKGLSEDGVDLFSNDNLSLSVDTSTQGGVEYYNALTRALQNFNAELDANRRVELDGIFDPVNVTRQTGDTAYEFYLNLWQLTDEEKQQLQNEIKAQATDILPLVQDEISSAFTEQSQKQQEADLAWRDFLPSLVATMKSQGSFKDLADDAFGKDIQSFAIDMVSNLDRSVAEEMDKTDPYGWVRSNIILPLTKLDDNDRQTVSETYKKLLELNPNDITPENQLAIENIINTLADLLGKDPIQIRLAFGFDESGIQTKYAETMRKAYAKFGADKYDDKGFATGDTVLDNFAKENSIDTKEEVEFWNKCIEESETREEAMQKYLNQNPSDNETDISLSISDTVNQLNTKLKPAMDSLKSAYQSIFTEDGFTLDSVSSSMLSSIQDSILALNNLEGADIDIPIEDFEKFADVLTNVNTTEEQADDAFDNLATSIINGIGVTGQLSDETAGLVIQLLEEMGIVNANEVVTNALALQKERLAQASKISSETTYEHAVELVNEAGASEIAGMALAQLALEKIHVNGQTISTSADIENIIALANAAGASAEALATLTQAKAILAGGDAYGRTQQDWAADILSQINNGTYEYGFNLDADDFKVDFKGVGKDSASKAGKDAGEAYKEALEDELSDLDKIIGYIGDLFNDEIDALETAKNNAIDALEEAKEKELDALEKQKSALEKYKDALEDANKERELAMSLQKAQYELQRMLSQRTALVFSENKGFHYVQDTEGIREKRSEVENIELDIKLHEIDEQIEDIDSEIEDVEEKYEKLISDTEAYYDAQINSLKLLQEQVESITKAAENQEILALLEKYGINVNDILSGNEEALAKLKNRYLEVSKAISDYELTGDMDDLATSSDKASSSVSKVADATTKIDDTKVANLSSAMEDLGDTSNLDALYNAFDQLKTIITEISNTLNGVENGNGLVKALSDLGTLSLGTTGEEAIGLIGQFVALKDAIDAVTTAISGGAEGQNLPQGGAPTKQGAMTPSGSPDSGGTGGLTQALKEQVEEAKNLLPEEIALFSGEKDSLLSAVTKVTTAIAGGGDSEGGKKKEQSGQREGEADTSHLMGALDAQYKEAEIKIPQERDWFNELATAIELCVTHLTKMSELLQGLTTGDLQFGLVNFHSQGTVGKAFAKGTGKYKGLPSSEKNTLRSEYGQPELTVYPDGTTELTTEPTMSDLPKDTVIFNEEQTRRIIKNKGTVLGNAHSEGTITLSNGTILQPANLGYDVDALVQSLKNNMDYIINPLSSIDKNVDTIMRTTNNISNHNTMQNVTNFSTGDIIVQGVQNVDGFAKAVKTHFPNAMLQAIHKR